MKLTYEASTIANLVWSETWRADVEPFARQITGSNDRIDTEREKSTTSFTFYVAKKKEL
jgi:hypothetical protein